MKTILREENAKYIEETLANGGTIVELGAGRLIAARELAANYPNGTIIAIDPFLDDEDTNDLPENIRVVKKKVEEVTDGDVEEGSVDACYSAYTFDYPPDKLAFLKSTYTMLKDRGKAIIHYVGNPMQPDVASVYGRIGAKDLIETSKRDKHGDVFTMTKDSNRKLDFGEYSFETIPIGKAWLTADYSFSSD